jgi:hypothetical protein
MSAQPLRARPTGHELAIAIHSPGPDGAPVYRGLDLGWFGAYLDRETGSRPGTCRDELVNRAIAGEIVIERCEAAPSGLVITRGMAGVVGAYLERRGNNALQG